jgi:hypothetical protein
VLDQYRGHSVPGDAGHDLARTPTAGTPSAAALNITSGIDIRMEAQLDELEQHGASDELKTAPP